jgi:DNA-directed RNA polymerase specialized sigma24 family protein
MGFTKLMATPLGRLVRIVAGIVLIGVGIYAGTTGEWSWGGWRGATARGHLQRLSLRPPLRGAFQQRRAAPAGLMAEDVVQDAAVSTLRATAGFRSDADVCTWFQRICLNACQALRRHRSAASLEQAARLEQLWRDPGYTVDPERVVLALEDQRRLRDAMAADTGIPLPTVKSHLRRGPQALVSLLAGVEE